MDTKAVDSKNINNAAANGEPIEDFRLAGPDAETVSIEHSRLAVKAADEYVQDNRWNWH
ncbi:MAG TPA: hypothetical protein VLS47_07935 [Gallionella sp.]|nr:hypothetical protein [Gallionella sp.]